MDGAELIAAERQRQIDEEGWTSNHDDKHAYGELALAAVCYASPREVFIMRGHNGYHFEDPWPFDGDWDNRLKDTRVRQLAKAGALIAAEIDRLKRRGE